MIGGQVALAPAIDFAVLNAASDALRVVGSIAAPNPGFHSLAVRSDITGPDDLRGKTIGFVDGTSEAYVTSQYLAQNGIDETEVELVALPGLFELVSALQTDEIQAAWVWANGVDEVNASEGLEIITDDSEVLETVGMYLVARSDFAEESLDVIERVLRAYDKASEVIQEEPDRAAEIIAEGVSGDAEAIAAVLPNQNFRVEFSQTQLDSFDQIAQYLIDRQVLGEDCDIREFLDLEHQEAAVPGSVSADLGG